MRRSAMTERKEHLETLAGRLAGAVAHGVVLSGGMGPRRMRAALRRLDETPANEPRVILATGRYIGEGFDDPRLDTLFVTLPVSWRGTIAQYVGRLVRDGVDESLANLCRPPKGSNGPAAPARPFSTAAWRPSYARWLTV